MGEYNRDALLKITKDGYSVDVQGWSFPDECFSSSKKEICNACISLEKTLREIFFDGKIDSLKKMIPDEDPYYSEEETIYKTRLTIFDSRSNLDKHHIRIDITGIESGCVYFEMLICSIEEGYMYSQMLRALSYIKDGDILFRLGKYENRFHN